MLVFACPSCGTKLEMSDDLAGKKVRCASCQTVIAAPAQTSEAITAEPAPAVPTAISSEKKSRAGRRDADDDDRDDDDRDDRPRRTGGGGKAAAAGIGVGAIVLIVMGIGACLAVPCLIALLVPAVQKVREAAARTQTMNNMKQIGLACHSYHDTFKTLPTPKVTMPPANAPVDLSWRVSLLPFIEQAPLFNNFDQTTAWDSPRNQPLANMMPMQYANPSREAGPERTMTFFQYFTGPDTLWPQNQKRSIVVPDGTSNTFLFAEAAGSVTWSKAGDMNVQPGQPPPLPSGRFLAGLADGSVHMVDRSRTTDATLQLYINPNDGMVPPPLD